VTARSKAIAVSIIGIIAIVGLYFGNFAYKPKSVANNLSKPTEITFEAYEQIQIKSLPDSSLSNYNTHIKNKDFLSLSKFWSDKNIALQAYASFKNAEITKHREDYINSGDLFFSALRSNTDTVIRNNLITFAVRSYENALNMGSDIDTKIKLASVYVESSIEPMKGITMLRQIVDSLPNHIGANIMLGRFAIMSGQYDKAKERLDKVLIQQPDNTEALYFMAITQEGLGNTEKAIELLEICKKMVDNEGFTAEIDEYINGLKNKN
jgi:tetratricopeptide (TPR) repeat protein